MFPETGLGLGFLWVLCLERKWKREGDFAFESPYTGVSRQGLEGDDVITLWYD